MIYDVAFEAMPKEELRELQLKRLQNLCSRVYAKVAFYREAFDDLNVRPEDIKSLEDLRRLPFTVKDDLRNNYPFGLLAVPKDNVVRIHASSGTTGKASVTGYTHQDVSNWAIMMARSFVAAGATSKDIVHNAYGYGLFTGGLGAHYGSEKLGAATVPVSGGGTKRQALLLRDFGATVLTCTPSYALHLYESALEEGIDIKFLPLKIGIFGAEPWTEAMRQQIEDKLGLDNAIDIYGLSEIMGPGVGIECSIAKDGLHIMEDHFLIEILNPQTLEPTLPGEIGELVITTLTKEAQPLIRYRTRDLACLVSEPCLCGRTFVRISKLIGRSDDMLLIRGVNVFPSQIEALLMETKSLLPHYQLVVTKEGALDNLEIQVELTDQFIENGDEIRNVELLGRRLQKAVKDFLGVSAKVKFVDSKSIVRSEGKAIRVLDLRDK